jgi:superfamily II DNA or RNA helicase
MKPPIKNMKRLFSQADKRSVHRIYGHVCADCGSILSLGEARADHVQSYANGGKTHGSNIALRCDYCNRAKGKSNADQDLFKVAKPKLNINLRPWQAECLENQIKMASMGAKDYFVAAGVGSGKTVQALSLYLTGDYDMAIIITPKSGIRGSWQSDATKMGINLRSVVTKNDFIGDGDRQLPNGYVLNAQMIQSVLNDIKILCQRFKVLIIIDEAHHYGDDLCWTQNVTAAVEDAAFLLAMSGTPYRNDGQRIIALKYQRDGNKAVGMPDYERSYEKSLEAGETAPVITRFVSGSVAFS